MGMSEKRRRNKIRSLLRVWGNRCFYCDELFSLSRPATLEHMIPRSLGGTGDLLNLCLAHKDCNSIRGNAAILVTLKIFREVEGRRKRQKALQKYKVMANKLARNFKSTETQRTGVTPAP